MVDPVAFGNEIANLGYYYNTAEVVSEVEGPGYGTISTLLNANYPNIWRHRRADSIPHIHLKGTPYGWSTNWNRKSWAIGFLKYLFNQRALVIHDETTYHQLRMYVSQGIRDFRPGEKDGYDDAVMALAIGCICANTEGPPDWYDGSVTQNTGVSSEPSWTSWGQSA